jgi:predicted dehydrogenase
MIGEVCHFVDLLGYLVEAKPVKIYAQSILDDREDTVNNDTLSISLKFEDGSIGCISYLACGDSSFPKERIEVFGEDSVAVIDDFKKATFTRKGKTKKIRKMNQDKGHQGELEAYVEAVKGGEEMPIKFEEIVTTTLVTFKILESLEKGAPVEIPELTTSIFEEPKEI